MDKARILTKLNPPKNIRSCCEAENLPPPRILFRGEQHGNQSKRAAWGSPCLQSFSRTHVLTLPTNIDFGDGPIVSKPKHPPHPRAIAAGSGTVMINGKPAAVTGGAVSCGGVTVGSGTVIIGS